MDDLISRKALIEKLKEEHDDLMQDPEVDKKTKWREAVIYHRTCKCIESAPSVDAVSSEKYNDLREAFVDFVCSGVHNPAPYCTNKFGMCVNGFGWCMPESGNCEGFNPDGERKEKGDGRT